MDFAECRKAHGYITDDDNESELSSFDENYEKLKIPPVPVNELKLVYKTDAGSIKKVQRSHVEQSIYNKNVLSSNVQQSTSGVGVNSTNPFDTQHLRAPNLVYQTTNPFLQDNALLAKNNPGLSTHYGFIDSRQDANSSEQYMPSVNVYDIDYRNVYLETNAQNQYHAERSPAMTYNANSENQSPTERNNQSENLCCFCCDLCNII